MAEHEVSDDAAIEQETKIKTWGVIGILIGIVVILVMIVIEELARPQAHWAAIVIELAVHLGMAAIIFGLVGIIMDFPHWQKYFQERLAKTVIERNYLKTLSKEQLITLQTDTLKAFFEADEIDREESFLEYFRQRIHGYIGRPYREDTDGIITVTLSPDDNEYQVDEKISYTCRKVGTSIQPDVRWMNVRKADIVRLREFSIAIEVPLNFYQSPNFQAQHPRFPSRRMTFELNGQNREKLVPIEVGMGYKLSLADFSEVDELYVEVHSKYVVARPRPFSWTMAHPSKNLTVTINYPRHLTIDVNLFGIEEGEYHEEERAGLYALRYGSWLLPNSGVCYSFLPHPDEAEVAGKEARTLRPGAAPRPPDAPRRTTELLQSSSEPAPGAAAAEAVARDAPAADAAASDAPAADAFTPDASSVSSESVVSEKEPDAPKQPVRS